MITRQAEEHEVSHPLADETDASTCDIAVIELNPFFCTTDGALFSWERESHILRGEDG